MSGRGKSRAGIEIRSGDAAAVSVSDLVVVDLADEVAELRQRAELADSYRAEAFEAIERLGEKMRELETANRLIANLREQLRDARREKAPADDLQHSGECPRELRRRQFA